MSFSHSQYEDDEPTRKAMRDKVKPGESIYAQIQEQADMLNKFIEGE